MSERPHGPPEEGMSETAHAASSRLALRLLLAALLTLATALVGYVTYEDTRAARGVAEKALAGTALALASAAEKALLAGGGTDQMRSILSDRVVAYAFITSPDGIVRFHTNPTLVGTRVADVPADARDADRAESAGKRIRLGTGVPAYEFRHGLHGEGREGETLWLVLHTTPIDRAVNRSRRVDWGVGAMIVLLWGAGFLLDRLGARVLRLRDEMGRKERLTLVGQMTATLSHEIRNAVGGVKGYAQLLDEQTPAEDPRKRGLGLILKSAARIEGLVDELLRFSRPETYRIAPVELGPAVADAVRAAAGEWRGRVDVEVDERTGVLADPEKLLRVLTNGVRNAVDAMPRGGTLTIRSRADRRRRVTVTISDTGGGLDEVAAARVFTPFFTTKADGTGLGLAYSRKVVEEMSGVIELTNGTEGAILSITLPSAGEAAGS